MIVIQKEHKMKWFLISWLVTSIIGLIVMIIAAKNAPLMPDDYDNDDDE